MTTPLVRFPPLFFCTFVLLLSILNIQNSTFKITTVLWILVVKNNWLGNAAVIPIKN